MERLWTPWRMQYVASASESSADECLFCEVLAGSDDEQNLVVFRDKRALIVLNLYPYNTGHLMVAPVVHQADPTQVSAQDWHALWDTTQYAMGVLQQEYRPDGFNVGMNLGRVAGAGVPGHLHVHVVPRWNGDANFMPVVADTKVMPESPDQTYRRLEPLFERRRAMTSEE